MSRPKGSKNKKTLVNEAQLEGRIAEQRKVAEKLQAEEKSIITSIDAQREKLKAKRREVRTAQRSLDSLLRQAEQVKAENAQQAQKSEMEKIIKSLLDSGKSAEEIIEMLKSK